MCPLCGTEKALPEIMCLHGLDGFLQAIQPILSQPQESCFEFMVDLSELSLLFCELNSSEFKTQSLLI